MKNYLKHFMSLAFVLMMSVTACIEDGLRENPAAEGCKEIPSLNVQAGMIENSLNDLRGLEMDESLIDAVESHIGLLRSGISWEEGTLATLDLQKKLSVAAGVFKAELNDDDDTQSAFKTFEEGVSLWLGKHMDAFWSAAAAQAEADAVIAGLGLDMQKIRIEGIASDLEAGLRKGASLEDVAALAASVEKNASEAEKLNASLAEITLDLEEAYRTAISSVAEIAENFDAAELKTMNKSAEAVLKSAGVSLQDLVSRVAICEASITQIMEKLGELETEVDDLLELLDMIQSVTFMSEYSNDKAVAKYSLDFDNRTSEGYMKRKPASSVSLKYIIRPAAAAQALAQSALWDNELKVIGYYASAITKAAPKLMEFDIEGVTLGDGGVVTVSVRNTLTEDFFFKKTGAKVALSIDSGKTDMTSDFVEIVPKDMSDDVYVTSLDISSKSIEVDNGQTAKLIATVTPGNATEGGVVWTSSNNNVLTVSSDGVVSAKSVGNAVVTVTTTGINEWGNQLSASCNVKVNPSVRISGPNYVEQGGQIELRIESPDYISPDLIEWSITGVQYQAYATVTETESGSGSVYGNGMWFDTDTRAYKAIPVTCTIAGAMPLTLTHEIRVVAKQPKGIAIEGLSYGQNILPSVKKGAAFTINASLEPAGVDPSLFRIIYQSSAPGVAHVNFDSGYVEGRDFGTAFIDVKVTDSGKYNYFYPARDEFVRQVAVTVEPYYVTQVILPATMEMKLGEETPVAVDFVSDGGEGIQPEDKTLTWSSNNTDVVEVDPETGRLTAKSEGSAVITATTAGELSVPEGSAHKSATCVVVVRSASAADPKVGDFYYDDGSWSTELDAGKTVIGVVFSLENATNYDVVLRNDHPACSHGLVVGLVEYSSCPNSLSDMVFTNALCTEVQPFTTDQANGYSITKALDAYGKSNNETTAMIWRYDLGTLKVQSDDFPSPASAWYLPAYFELSKLRENLNAVNSSLATAEKTLVDNKDYWVSSFEEFSARQYDSVQLYSMSTGNWGKNLGWNGTYKDNYPVRYILAF